METTATRICEYEYCQREFAPAKPWQRFCRHRGDKCRLDAFMLKRMREAQESQKEEVKSLE